MTSTAHATEPTVTFATDRATFVDALATVGIAVPTRPDAPTLGGVLLEGDDRGDLVLSTSDGSTAIQVRIPNAAHTTGRVLVNYSELADLTRSLVKGTAKKVADRLPVTITGDPSHPALTLAGHTWPLTALSHTDFRTALEAPRASTHVDRATFRDLVTRVLPCVSTDTIDPPALQGVCLQARAGALRLVGTNRYLLALAHMPAITDTEAADWNAVLTPRLLAKLLRRSVGERVSLGISDDTYPFVSLTCGQTTVVTRTIDNIYPGFEFILTKTARATRTVSVNRDDILASLNRVAPMLTAKHRLKICRQIDITISPHQTSALVTPVLAEGTDEITTPPIPARVENITAETRIRFTLDYLTTVLTNALDGDVTFHIGPDVTKAILVTQNPDDIKNSTAFRQVLMPVRPPEKNRIRP